MSKTIVTKFGTKINIEGLDPKQIDKVRSMAEDKGAYGAKGAALASTFQKQNSKATEGGKVGIPIGEDKNMGIDPRTGRVNPGAAFAAAPKLLGAEDLAGEAKGARDAAYNYETKDYEQMKAREVEAKKQELSDRGIPIQAGQNNLWADSLSDIGKKYTGMYDQAGNQAWNAGLSQLGTEGNLANSNYNSFMQSYLGTAGQNTNVYGIQQNSALQKAQIEAQKQIAAQRLRGSGGGGVDTSPIIGGVAPGFNVSNG